MAYEARDEWRMMQDAQASMGFMPYAELEPQRPPYRRQSFLARHKALFTLLLVVVLVVALVSLDFVVNSGKAYHGVTVGGIDVSGMTYEEIVDALQEAYEDQLAETVLTIFGDTSDGSGSSSWTLTAEDLGATVPYDELASEALAVGRGSEGLVERVRAAMDGRDIEVTLTLDEDALEEFALLLDEALGTPLVEYGFVVVDGVASVTTGSDGVVVDREALAADIESALLDGGAEVAATLVDASVNIDAEAAQEVCDQVNSAIAAGATFVCGTGTLSVDAAELGSWVTGSVEEVDGVVTLVAHVDATLAATTLASFAWSYFEDGDYTVTFEEDDEGEIWVSVGGSSSAPMTDAAVETLEAALFDEGISCPTITIEFGEGTGTLSFDDALSLGIIVAFASYTTSFNTGSSYANRVSNINLAASYLTNSIINPGESWSFNETCGERTTERGFLAAGAIVYGEYTTDIGGGICQVATTVFNCIYEAGLKITERHNHSLYISSYPTGRDAAVSWPYLDLVWENDTDSSILLCVTCGESTVTTTLYGVDPGYTVTTVTGSWEEGEAYDTVTEVDETLEPGTSYVETAGVNGKKITVTRTVTDSDGNVVRTDTFTSSYSATDEVIVVGPDAEEEEDAEDEEAEETEEGAEEEAADDAGDAEASSEETTDDSADEGAESDETTQETDSTDSEQADAADDVTVTVSDSEEESDGEDAG